MEATMEQILDAREARVSKQKELLEQYKTPLLCFTMNIPGPEKWNRDVAIGISHSGQTKDVVNAVRLAGEKGAETICISNYTHSPLTEVSNIHLLTGGHEASFMSETMVSRISQLAIIDMLYVGIILSDYDAYSAGLSYVNEQVRDKAYEKPY